MVKVRVSQIPEESGNAKRVPKNSEEQEERIDHIPSGIGEDEEEHKAIRLMFHIPEVGFSISLFGIETIDKSFRVYESTNGTGEVKPQWGIIINKDMEPTLRYPRTNVDFWFDTEEVRDKRYDEIIEGLIQAGYKFLNA